MENEEEEKDILDLRRWGFRSLLNILTLKYLKIRHKIYNSA